MKSYVCWSWAECTPCPRLLSILFSPFPTLRKQRIVRALGPCQAPLLQRSLSSWLQEPCFSISPVPELIPAIYGICSALRGLYPLYQSSLLTFPGKLLLSSLGPSLGKGSPWPFLASPTTGPTFTKFQRAMPPGACDAYK